MLGSRGWGKDGTEFLPFASVLGATGAERCQVAHVPFPALLKPGIALRGAHAQNWWLEAPWRPVLPRRLGLIPVRRLLSFLQVLLLLDVSLLQLLGLLLVPLLHLLIPHFIGLLLGHSLTTGKARRFARTTCFSKSIHGLFKHCLIKQKQKLKLLWIARLGWTVIPLFKGPTRAFHRSINRCSVSTPLCNR